MWFCVPVMEIYDNKHLCLGDCHSVLDNFFAIKYVKNMANCGKTEAIFNVKHYNMDF
jgi:hypothetical protein